MEGLSFERKLLAIAGFVALGLSPSFEDWQQSPEKRKEFLIYYGVAVGLFWAGILA